MNYLDCPSDHLKAALIGLAITVVGLVALGAVFPLPDNLPGLAASGVLGAIAGFAGARASAMIGHHLTCERRPR